MDTLVRERDTPKSRSLRRVVTPILSTARSPALSCDNGHKPGVVPTLSTGRSGQPAGRRTDHPHAVHRSSRGPAWMPGSRRLTSPHTGLRGWCAPPAVRTATTATSPSASNACSIHCRPGVTLRMAVTDDRAAGRPRPVRAAGDGPAPGADLSPFDRQPPQDLTAEQSVLGGMLMSKDAIADVVEVAAARGFLPAGAPDRLRRASSTCTAAGSRPTRSRWPPSWTRPGRPVPGRRRGVPAHADGDGADRGERRVLRGDRGGEGDPAAAGGGRHPDRAVRLRRRRGRRGRRDRGPRAGRDLRGHRAADQRGLRRPGGAAAADDGRDRRDRDPAAGVRGGADRVRRPRQPDQRAAPGSDDHRGGPAGDREVDAGVGHRPARRGEAPQDRR